MARLLGTREAAQRAGLSREQLLRRIERREIAARYVEGRWLVDSRSTPDVADLVGVYSLWWRTDLDPMYGWVPP